MGFMITIKVDSSKELYMTKSGFRLKDGKKIILSGS
jgi:hypothetical protein